MKLLKIDRHYFFYCTNWNLKLNFIYLFIILNSLMEPKHLIDNRMRFWDRCYCDAFIRAWPSLGSPALNMREITTHGSRHASWFQVEHWDLGKTPFTLATDKNRMVVNWRTMLVNHAYQSDQSKIRFYSLTVVMRFSN